MEQLPDLKMLKRDILWYWRGDSSSKAMSTQLGFSYNQYARWQNERTRFLWRDFVQLSALRNTPLAAILKQHLNYEGSLTTSADLSFFLIGKRYKDLTNHLSFSRFTLSRWAKGNAEPTFEDMCRLIAIRSLALPDIIEDLIGTQNLPSFANFYQEYEQRRRKLYDRPYLGALYCAMGLESYMDKPHDASILMRHLGLSLSEVEQGIQDLLDTGAIRHHNGRYERINFNIDTRDQRHKTNSSMLYWLQRAHSMMAAQEGNFTHSLYGYRTMNLSEQGLKKMRQLCHKLMQEAHTIHTTDKDPPQHTLVMNFQLINLQEDGSLKA